jgi:hypothetical protein
MGQVFQITSSRNVPATQPTSNDNMTWIVATGRLLLLSYLESSVCLWPVGEQFDIHCQTRNLLTSCINRGACFLSLLSTVLNADLIRFHRTFVFVPRCMTHNPSRFSCVRAILRVVYSTPVPSLCTFIKCNRCYSRKTVYIKWSGPAATGYAQNRNNGGPSRIVIANEL